MVGDQLQLMIGSIILLRKQIFPLNRWLVSKSAFSTSIELDETALKAIWAYQIMLKIQSARLQDYYHDAQIRCLRQRILSTELPMLQNDSNCTYDKDISNKVRSHLMSYFDVEKGSTIDYQVYMQDRIKSANEHETFAFNPNLLVTPQIFNLILRQGYRRNVVSGPFGISKSISFVLYCELSKHITQYLVNGDKSAIQWLIKSKNLKSIPKMLYFTFPSTLKRNFNKTFSQTIINQCKQLKLNKNLIGKNKNNPDIILGYIREEYQKHNSVKLSIIFDQFNILCSKMRKYLHYKDKSMDSQIQTKIMEEYRQHIESYSRVIQASQQLYQRFYNSSANVEDIFNQFSRQNTEQIKFYNIDHHLSTDRAFINYLEDITKQSGKIDLLHTIWFEMTKYIIPQGHSERIAQIMRIILFEKLGVIEKINDSLEVGLNLAKSDVEIDQYKRQLYANFRRSSKFLKHSWIKDIRFVHIRTYMAKSHVQSLISNLVRLKDQQTQLLSQFSQIIEKITAQIEHFINDQRNNKFIQFLTKQKTQNVDVSRKKIQILLDIHDKILQCQFNKKGQESFELNFRDFKQEKWKIIERSLDKEYFDLTNKTTIKLYMNISKYQVVLKQLLQSIKKKHPQIYYETLLSLTLRIINQATNIEGGFVELMLTHMFRLKYVKMSFQQSFYSKNKKTNKRTTVQVSENTTFFHFNQYKKDKQFNPIDHLKQPFKIAKTMPGQYISALPVTVTQANSKALFSSIYSKNSIVIDLMIVRYDQGKQTYYVFTIDWSATKSIRTLNEKMDKAENLFNDITDKLINRPNQQNVVFQHTIFCSAELFNNLPQDPDDWMISKGIKICLGNLGNLDMGFDLNKMGYKPVFDLFDQYKKQRLKCLKVS